MFTGIIESQGVLRRNQRSKGGCRLTFDQVGTRGALRKGESVSVDGVCLTVTSSKGRRFTVDVIPETLAGTTLSGLQEGGRVNLERSLRVGDSLGGHWVTGHVEGVGRILEMERRETNFRLKIKASPDIIQLLVRKGSVAIDGISFTVQELDSQFFVIGVIPQTYRATTMQRKQVGDPVNLETDLFAKLVHDFLSRRNSSSLKVKELKKQGF